MDKRTELALAALKSAVELHPEIVPHLHGNAAWFAGVFEHKVGEAPDDEQRLKDERRVERALTEFFAEQQERVIRYVKKQYKDYQLGFWDNESRLLWERLSEDFVGIMIHGTQGGLTLLGVNAVGVNIDNINWSIIRYARQYREEWLKYITETTRGTVEKAISEWIASGDPISELVKTLSNPELGMFSKMRAKRIATTEVTRLHAMGNKLAWEESGYVKEFIWMTAEDERVCPICGAKANKVFPLAQLSDIPAHINCRCWGKPVVSVEAFGEEIDRILAE